GVQLADEAAADEATGEHGDARALVAIVALYLAGGLEGEHVAGAAAVEDLIAHQAPEAGGAAGGGGDVGIAVADAAGEVAGGQHLAVLVDDLEDVEAEGTHGRRRLPLDLARHAVLERPVGERREQAVHQRIVAVGEARGRRLDV